MIVLLILPTVNALIDCEEILTPNKIPCQIITTWEYPDCNTTLANIYNSIPTLISIRNFTDYLGTGRCYTTWNISAIDSYIWNVSNGDAGRIIVQNEEDTMASLAIMLFMMAVTAAIFMMGKNTHFSNNEVANHIFRNCLYLIGIWIVVLDLTIAINIASNYGMGIDSILKRLLWFSHNGAYIFSLYLIWNAIQGGLSLWKVRKERERMGYE